MSYRALFVSVGLALAWTAMGLYAMRPAAPAPLRIFVATQGVEQYRVEAHSFRVEGFCVVFVRSDVPFAAVCGQHTVSEAVEVP